MKGMTPFEQAQRAYKDLLNKKSSAIQISQASLKLECLNTDQMDSNLSETNEEDVPRELTERTLTEQTKLTEPHYKTKPATSIH